MKVADLHDESIYTKAATSPPTSRRPALTYGIMSEFTSFVAVDSAHVTSGDTAATVGRTGARARRRAAMGTTVVQTGTIRKAN